MGGNVRNNEVNTGQRAETANPNNINIQHLKNPKKRKKKSRLIQFYSANVPEDGGDLPCMDKWTNSMESQIIFVEDIFDYCFHIPDKKWATIYKVIIGILATVFLYLEYRGKPEIMSSYLLVAGAFCYSYILSIIILNIARYIAIKNRETETNFDTFATIWYYLNAFGLVSVCDYYYVYSICGISTTLRSSYAYFLY